MARVKVVTGYSPLPVINVSRERFQELGQQLVDAVGCPIQIFNDYPVEACSLYRLCKQRGVKPSARDIPADRFPNPWAMVLSNIIQCQKPEWVNIALDWDKDDTDVFIWIDFGIFKQQGITYSVVRRFIEKVEHSNLRDEIHAPGLISPTYIDMGIHHTRFCGSIVIVPRELVPLYNGQMHAVSKQHIEETGTISWDVNYLAVCERDNCLKFCQYLAWWDQTQFTNY